MTRERNRKFPAAFVWGASLPPFRSAPHFLHSRYNLGHVFRVYPGREFLYDIQSIDLLALRTGLPDLFLCILLVHDLGLLQGVLDISTSLLLIDSPENEVHLLQSPSLGFLEENEDETTHGETEDTKHEEGPPSNLVNGPRSDLGDDEVEQPLSSCSKSNTVSTKTSWEDLKVCISGMNQAIWDWRSHLAQVHPRGWSPRCGISNDIEVNHGHHGD